MVVPSFTSFYQYFLFYLFYLKYTSTDGIVFTLLCHYCVHSLVFTLLCSLSCVHYCVHYCFLYCFLYCFTGYKVVCIREDESVDVYALLNATEGGGYALSPVLENMDMLQLEDEEFEEPWCDDRVFDIGKKKEWTEERRRRGRRWRRRRTGVGCFVGFQL